MQGTDSHPLGDSGARSCCAVRAKAMRTYSLAGGSFMQDMPPLPELSVNDLIEALNAAVYHSRPGDETVSPGLVS